MDLTLHLTTACNMRCTYCYSPPRDGVVMSEETGRRTMVLGGRISPGSCGIVFSGGEPLLHQDLIQSLVEYGHELERHELGRFHYRVITNGLLLDQTFLDFVLRNDIAVAMSFDGVRQAHDRHRRLPNGKGSFDDLVRRLELLLSVRPYASVLLVVTPQTVRWLAESICFLMDLSCRYVTVSLNYGAQWRESDLRVLADQYMRLGELYVEWTRAERKFYLSPLDDKLAASGNRWYFRKHRCELANRQLSVDPEGYLYPCVQFPRAGPKSRWCVGHVQHGIDEGVRRRIAAQSLVEKTTCALCGIRDRCNNTCGCINWQSTGRIDAVSPILCRHERILVPIVDRVGKRLQRPSTTRRGLTAVHASS